MSDRTTKGMSLLLAILLALAPLFSVEVLSRCLVTGALSSNVEECCFVEAAPCCEADGDSPDDSGAEVAQVACGCCETVVHRPVPDMPAHEKADAPVPPPPAVAEAPFVEPSMRAAAAANAPDRDAFARAGPRRFVLLVSFRI